MMELLNIILLGLTSLLAIPTLVFSFQVFFAQSLPPRLNKEIERGFRVAVLVPAHNEAEVIARTLSSIASQLGENDMLLVVADNCTDSTASIAAKYTKNVIERQHEIRRGKGYALDFGLQFLQQNELPEVVIIIDADCQLSTSCINVLAEKAKTENRPVQALYLMGAPDKKLISQAVAEFAWLVKNQVRALGLMRLGLPCQLMGTGMAFPWEVLKKADLAHGNMVEDMKLGVDLAIQGFPPSFCPNALVTSEFPVSTRVINEQRKRWEHGHLATIIAELPRLLIAAFKQKDQKLLGMALDLSVPPLSLLGLCLMVAVSLAATLTVITNNTVLIQVLSILISFFMVAVFTAWFKFGREVMTLKDLCGIPFYILRKIPLYFSFLLNRQREWVKTERD